MNALLRAGVVALLVFPAVSLAQDQGVEEERTTDELVVVGRSVSTTATKIEIEREMIVDTATVLKDIPGANVNSNGLITGIAQYRGMFGDRISVEIDQLGMTSGGPNAMDAPLSYVSPMITEELVVERGIASVSKAPESIGGYVNTTLARGRFGEGAFEPSGTIGARYQGNGNIRTTGGRLTVANRNHRFSLVAELDKGNDISTPSGKIVPTRLDRQRYDVSYAFDKEDAQFLLFAGRLDTADSGTPALPMDIRLIETDMVGAQFGYRVNDSLDLEGRFLWNDVEHLMDNFSLRGAPMPMMFRQNYATGSGSQFYLAGLLDLGDSALRLGLDGSMSAHDSVISNPNMALFRVENFTDVERDVLGVFAEWRREYEASDLELGLRFKRVATEADEVGAMGMADPMGANVAMLAEAFNTADRSLHWNSIDAVAKYRYESSDRTEWIFELGSKTRAPSYQELYLWLPLQAAGGLADGRTYIGGLSLEEERSNEIVLGMTSHTGRFSVSPQVFYRRIDDYIQGVPSSDMLANMVSTMMSGKPALQFANVDAEIWGADIAWSYELGERWFVDGIASFTRGRRRDVDDNLYRLAPFNGSLGLTYVADTWSIKPEVVLYADQDRVSSYNDEQPTPGYELVNVAFAWNPLESLRVEARVDNLLNERYQDHLAGINRAMGSGIAVGERIYGAERTFSAGLMFSF